MSSALALLFAKAGHTVRIGSRDESKARAAANKLKEALPSANVSSGENHTIIESGYALTFTRVSVMRP